MKGVMQHLVSISVLHGTISQNTQRKRCSAEHFNRTFSIYSDQTKPQENKWFAQLLMPAILPVCRLNLKASTACGGNRSLSQCSALELQNIFWGKSCKCSFKSTSWLQLIITFRLLIQSYDASPATTKVSSGGSKAGCAQDRLKRYPLCSPRTVLSDVDLWVGRYLTSEITHYENYDGNTWRCAVTSQKQFAIAWSFPRVLAHVSSSGVSWGPHQMPAAIKPTPSP